MANNENLKRLSPNEARKYGKIGGIASGQVRRKKRDLRFALLALMDMENEDGLTGMEQMAASLYQKAIEGDLASIKFIQAMVSAGNQIEENEELGLDLFL